ncbi:hypothetical protein ABID21_003116 [Pseudorhizobium tarimense]|uniref:Uncharacterized protein n=1 Tax=Pseudorhizobium tarimense TaxID=1079109 RepID=A0ABV2H8X0_9HYPH|nr:hypothetical protein [Pseudorhizobium tarimense]MCJ8520116.1 hypothetical protein [Pseudorhizobium tarimense]
MTQISPTIYEPDELALLERCLAEVCTQRGLQPSAGAATILAIEMFDLYQHGVRDPKDLQARLGTLGSYT